MELESDLLTRALALPEAERAELASLLLVSLGPDDPADDHQAGWELEVERRRLALDRGETTASPWTDAVDRMGRSIDRGADG